MLLNVVTDIQTNILWDGRTDGQSNLDSRFTSKTSQSIYLSTQIIPLYVSLIYTLDKEKFSKNIPIIKIQ